MKVRVQLILVFVQFVVLLLIYECTAQLSLVHILSIPDTSYKFGYASAISGNTIVVGAPLDAKGMNEHNDPTYNSGAAYVYIRQGISWTQQAYLEASNRGAGDKFGWSLSISNDTLVVGAPSEDSRNHTDPDDNAAGASGAAYVFVRSGTEWTQQAYLKASNIRSNAEFGDSVSISGDTIVVGARYEDSRTTGVNTDPIYGFCK
jgi:hypothetical protein